MSGTIDLKNPANFKKTLLVELTEEYPGSPCYVVKLTKEYVDTFHQVMQRGGNNLGLKIVFNINK